MKAEVNGIELYYEVKGEGKPLIMIHGNGEDHTIFDTAAEKLAGTYTCYLVDSRGHGQSTPAETLDYNVMAMDVLAFADVLGLDRPVYYGFSDGGIIGLICAIKEPERFERMIISGANIDPKGVKTWMYALVKGMYLFTHDPKLKMMLEQPHIDVKELNTIKVKTLVLAGRKDLIREEHTLKIWKNIPGAQIKLLEGEGHGSYIVHSDKIADLILAFAEQ